jgi:hypothetical protein
MGAGRHRLIRTVSPSARPEGTTVLISRDGARRQASGVTAAVRTDAVPEPAALIAVTVNV